MEYRITGVLWILVLLCWEAKADLLHSYHLENRSSTGFEDQIGSANLIGSCKQNNKEINIEYII